MQLSRKECVNQEIDKSLPDLQFKCGLEDFFCIKPPTLQEGILGVGQEGLDKVRTAGSKSSCAARSHAVVVCWERQKNALLEFNLVG